MRVYGSDIRLLGGGSWIFTEGYYISSIFPRSIAQEMTQNLIQSAILCQVIFKLSKQMETLKPSSFSGMLGLCVD